MYDCNLELLARTTRQENVPKSVFPKDTTEWLEWVLNRDRVGHKLGALNTRPRCQRVYDLDARLCQLREIFWTTLPDLASALLNGQITNGKRSRLL